MSAFPIELKYKRHPKFSANATAASFPEGNIKPYNKSSSKTHSLLFKFAVVPKN